MFVLALTFSRLFIMNAMAEMRLLPAVNEKLDTERATTGKLSEGATSVDVRIFPSFIRCSDELYLAVFSAEWRAKKPRHPPDFFLRL